MRITKEAAINIKERQRTNLEDGLLMVLNLDPPKPIPKYINAEVRDRLVRLVESIRSLIQYVDKAPRYEEMESEDVAHVESLLQPINRAFAWCTLNPQIKPNLITGRGLVISSEVARGSKNAFEGWAMLAIRDLMEHGDLSRLRTCENPSCERWFIARRQNQRWCSPNCRQQVFQGTEEFKAKRRRNYEAAKQLKAAKRKRVR